MGFRFGFAGQRAVLQEQRLTVEAIELLLAVAVEFCREVVGAYARGKIGGRAHERMACLNTQQTYVAGTEVGQG